MILGGVAWLAACAGADETSLPPDTDVLDTDPDLPPYSVQLARPWYLPNRSTIALGPAYSGDDCQEPFITRPWLFRFRWMDTGEPMTCEIRNEGRYPCRIQVEFPDEQAGILRVVAEIPAIGCEGVEVGRLFQGEALLELPYRRVAESDPDRDMIEVLQTRYDLEMLNDQVLLFSQTGRPETRTSLARDNTFTSLPP